MPELPEVEAVRRELQPVMEGSRFARVITRRPDLRGPLPRDFIARLEGITVRELSRRGKYLLARLSSNETLLMHLGMSGSFHVELPSNRSTPGDFHYPRSNADAHDHIVFQMSSGALVTFNDPRRFGSMELVAAADRSTHRVLSRLGPEPLSPEFDEAALARALENKKTTLKAALLDQRVVAGLGNIYVSEALNRARLSPRRRASSILTRSGAPGDDARRLVTAIKKVLTEAIDRKEVAYSRGRFRVYDREGARCPNRGCPGVIRRIVQTGRSTFFCPVCQR